MKTALGSLSARQTLPTRTSLSAMPCTGDVRSRSLCCWISKPRLTDAVLDMADKLIGRMFARAEECSGKALRRQHEGRRPPHAVVQGHDHRARRGPESERDGFAVVDEAVGWPKLLGSRRSRALADLADTDPLLRAADRYLTLRQFAPILIEALIFRAARDNDPMLCGILTVAELNRASKRDVPADAPMPFRKDWKRLISERGQPNRRLYETAVLATLRDKLRSGDVWVEGSSSYRRFDSYLLPPAAVPRDREQLGLPATADEWLAARGAGTRSAIKALRPPAARDPRRGRVP